MMVSTFVRGYCQTPLTGLITFASLIGVRTKVTQAVKDRLRAELEELESELRVHLPREIKRAKEFGDLRENAEYHAALARQQFVQARIRDLRQRLKIGRASCRERV